MMAGAVIFLLLLIALLAVPVTLTFQMSWQQTFQGDIKLLWLFGLVRVRLPSFQSKSPAPEGQDQAQQTAHLKRASSKISNLSTAVRQKAFRRRIMRFVSDFWHMIHKRNVHLHIRIGLGDPADTGQLWAVVGPVAGLLSNAQEARIEIVPEFFDTTFELDSSGNIRLIPLQIIYLTVALLMSPPVWRGIKQMRVVKQ